MVCCSWSVILCSREYYLLSDDKVNLHTYSLDLYRNGSSHQDHGTFPVEVAENLYFDVPSLPTTLWYLTKSPNGYICV